MPEPTAPLERDPVDELAEEFAERLRRGEHPSIDEYVRQHPQWAERIQQVFSALVVIERLKPGPGEGMAAGEAGSTAGPLQMPERIGDYRILREVGRGGMGVVYEAEQTSLGRHVALKVLQSSAVLDAKHIARFERESRAAAQLHHTNIVPVFGVGHEGHLHYYVMQFIQGQPLDDVLDELKWMRKRRRSEDLAQEERDRSKAAQIAVGLLSGQFEAEAPYQASSEPALDSSVDHHESPKRPDDSSAVLPGEHEISSVTHSDVVYWHCAARVGLQVADALEYAHEQGILHRDIKPANLLLDHHGTVWVTDFGLARVGEDDNLTQTGDVVGTLRYMPPEAFRGKFDAGSDIFGVGLVLYEMLALRPAFDAVDRSALMRQVSLGEIPPLRKVNPGVPRDLETIVMKAIEHEPAHRYASGKQMAEDLQRFLEDKPIRARRAGGVERAWRWSRRNPALAASLAVVSSLLVFLAVAGQLVARRQALARESTRQLLYVSDMNAIVQSWQNSNLSGMSDLLKRHAPTAGQEDLRGFEWYHLAKTYLSSVQQPSLPHDAGVLTAVFSPDGKTLLTGSGNTIWLWDMATRKIRGRLEGHEGPVRTLAISSDGATLASGGADFRVILWDVATGRPLYTLTEQPNLINAVAFSPGDKILATTSWRVPIKLWDVATGKEHIQLGDELGDGPGYGLCVAFSPDGKSIAMGGDRVVFRWELAQPDHMKALPGYKSLVRSVAFSRDSRLLAVASDDGVVRLHDCASGEQQSAWSGHLGPIRAMMLSPDGKTMATGSADHTVRLRQFDTGQEVAVFRGHTARINCVAFSPDGKTVVSGADDGRLVLWDTSQQGSETLKVHQADTPHLAFHPDGSVLASVSSERPSPVLWNIDTGRVNPLSSTSSDSMHAVAFSPDGKTLVWSEWSKLVIWDVAKRCMIEERETDEGDISSLAFSPDGKILASTATRYNDRSPKGAVKLWDTEVWPWRQIATLAGPESAYGGVAFSPDGKFLATPTGPDQRLVALYDVRSRKKVATLDEHTFYVEDVAFSPTENTLATAGRDGTIKLWDLATFRSIETLKGHTSQVFCLAYSRDGSTLVSGGSDSSISLWNLKVSPPGLVATLHGHTSSVLCAAFSPNGQTLATSSVDGTVKLWRAASEKDVANLLEGDE